MARSQEIERETISGYVGLALGLGLLGGALYFFLNVAASGPRALAMAIPLAVLGAFVLAGLYMLQPNEAAILLLFGQYKGTDRSEGLRWANPFYRKQKISLRAHNLASDRLKVNDKRGNPIEIAAAVVWRVADTAQASFDVEDYQQYVRIQAEAAVRHLASTYAYDEGEDLHPGEITLRAGQDRVAESLIRELTDRFDRAGIVVEDAKLTHLAYAPEIAQVMLRRQQAEAIIAARSKIVHGAVSMVEMALNGLSERDIVHLDDERRAAMVSNLLVVLCAESEVAPVINTGTLYQ
ncbi:SPFH domain-containing protein [Accumulibacter sp.]|uniref:SPFH domain-containing protein n=1 Tax=Accumulibacter sp. TaxID=2053492 RepID=UPI0025F83B81|nr:SPFH domain-containing protein [Accumulibacter sp.]MCM8594726.1 SPFH domain-containing protein [Accumulibacter sp.]MCM8625858.1 SPFH domain-containing protein [Accumulibacter sp.]MDS4048872.1 SPFH domain-containing protein [Accumulibacter sp.]